MHPNVGKVPRSTGWSRLNRSIQLSSIPAWVYGVIIFALLGLRVWHDAQAAGLGVTAYALDDAYIQLAIAKYFVIYRFRGVRPYESCSSSAAPHLFFLLSSFTKFVGNQAWLPLILNLVSAVGLTYVLDRLLKPYVASIGWRLLTLIAILSFLPIFTFVAMGMEHTLQLFLIATFFGFVRKIVDPAYRFSGKYIWMLCGLAGLIVLVRIECAVLFPIPFAYALIKRDFKCASALVLGPMLAVGLFALFSLSHAMRIEPNSMAVKRLVMMPDERNALPSDAAPLELVFDKIVLRLTRYQEIEALLIGLGLMLLLSFTKRGAVSSKLLLATCMLGFVVHANSGRFGWFYRYEGYLMIFSFLTLVAVASEEVKTAGAEVWRKALANGALIVSISLMPFRAWTATGKTVYAMANIGHQQLQMALFIQKFYPKASIVVNDIGAICYYSEPHLLDDAGLGTPSITQSKIDHTWGMSVIRAEMAKRDVEIGIIYLSPAWWPGNLGDLYPVGRWKIQHNVVADNSSVFFFATTPERAVKLVDNLQKFTPELPADVEHQYADLGQ